MEDIWTISSALEWTEAYLARKGDESPRLSAQWLLSDATKLSRIELYTHFDQPLTLPERNRLHDFVSRRGKGEPLQYITGEVGFRHITLKVRPGVLIPRPETEVLVSEALATLPPSERKWAEGSIFPVEGEETFTDKEVLLSEVSPMGNRLTGSEENPREIELAVEPRERKIILVVDLCTGSGCVACSIAYEHPETQVIATDIAPEAVALASENVSLLGLESRVEVLVGDLGAAIPEKLWGSVNLIVSNPPYIPRALLKEIPSEVVDFEPSLALDGGNDGLAVYRRIARWAFKALAPGGSLVVELHEDSLEEAASFAQSLGFSKLKIVRDLADRNRVLVAAKS